MGVAAAIGMTGLLVTAGLGIGQDDGGDGSSAHGCSQPWTSDAYAASTPREGSSAESRPTAVFDSFDGPAGAPPSPDNWTVIRGKGWDRGIQDYSPASAVLDGEGHLMLQARKSGDGYVSGRVETRRKASFDYGTLIARIKMPSGQGLWPAFWLVGADEDVNPWPAAGEIDVVEMVSDPRVHYSTVIGPVAGEPGYLQQQIVGEGPDLSADFHDYWVTHEEDMITVGLDDEVWATFTPESMPPKSQWVFNKPFCLILNLAVGGDWAGPPDDSTRFPATMLVDWVNWQPASP